MSKNICLITNYNYARFLSECIDSVVLQTKPFDKIIIIDDGSTDNSSEIIHFYQSKYPNIFSYFKKNQGQLSCFNFALNFIDPSDRIYFLDSDDIYPIDYLESISALPTSNCHFTYCQDIQFSNDPPSSSKLDVASQEDLMENTTELAKLCQCWFGGPTSCISISGSLYHRLFPFPFEEEWRSRADDVIVFATSILGYKKKFYPSIGVGYRNHGNNSFLNKEQPSDQLHKRQLAFSNIVKWYYDQSNDGFPLSLKNIFTEYLSLSKEQRSRHAVPSPAKIFRRYIISLLKA